MHHLAVDLTSSVTPLGRDFGSSVIEEHRGKCFAARIMLLEFEINFSVNLFLRDFFNEVLFGEWSLVNNCQDGQQPGRVPPEMERPSQQLLRHHGRAVRVRAAD